MTIAPLAKINGAVLFRLILCRGRMARMLCATMVVLAPPASAQETEPARQPETATLYDARLLRLSEIIGSVHYLRTLCKDPGSEEWRRQMQALLDKEAAGEAERRARLTAAFNRGYRGFAAVYTGCTQAAIKADAQYRAEGATLAGEITARFGN